MKNIYFIIMIILANLNLYGTDVIVEEGVINPENSEESHLLIESLNGLIDQKEKSNSENDYILKSQLLETSILIDEFKKIEYDRVTKTDDFFKPFLRSIEKLQDNDYSLNLIYKSEDDNNPQIRADFNILASKIEDQYYFYSPLLSNTDNWKKSTLHKNTFFFKNDKDIVKAQDYLSYIHKYDELIGNEPKESIFYFADDFKEALELIGVNYKLDYKDVMNNSLYSVEDGKLLSVNGTVITGLPAYDPHDLWHSRLRLAIKPKDIYKPVDEGCAFLFGGSWGYSWQNIAKRFKKYVDENPKANWLELMSEKVNYGDEKGKDLLVDYTINALIVMKIMREKDFESVRKLLSIGREQENLDKYFETLNSLTGINRLNFNQEINKLIKEI